MDKARKGGDHRDDDLQITDYFYYQLENHGTGNTYIFIVDYKNLKEYNPKDAPAIGVMYTDPLNPKRSLIRTYSDPKLMETEGAERIHERHRVLTDWLIGIGVNEKTAAEDACKLEHDISVESFQKLKEHIREKHNK